MCYCSSTVHSENFDTLESKMSQAILDYMYTKVYRNLR